MGCRRAGSGWQDEAGRDNGARIGLVVVAMGGALRGRGGEIDTYRTRRKLQRATVRNPASAGDAGYSGACPAARRYLLTA